MQENHEYQDYICSQCFMFIPIWKAMSLSLGYLKGDWQADRNEKNFQPNVESLRILLFWFCIFKTSTPKCKCSNKGMSCQGDFQQEVFVQSVLRFQALHILPLNGADKKNNASSFRRTRKNTIKVSETLGIKKKLT